MSCLEIAPKFRELFNNSTLSLHISSRQGVNVAKRGVNVAKKGVSVAVPIKMLYLQK